MDQAGKVKQLLESAGTLDADIIDYIASMVSDNSQPDDELFATIGEFLKDSLQEDDVRKLLDQIKLVLDKPASVPSNNEPKQLSQKVQISAVEDTTSTTDDNTTKSNAAISNRQRKQQKKQKKKPESNTETPKPEKEEQSQSFLSSRDENPVEDVIETRNIRFNSHHSALQNSKDLYVRGVSLSHGSTELLENADLKMIAGHRYGLVGRNGIGKTTLLQQLASGKFSQFSVNMRTLLVAQEAAGREDQNALQCVLQSDKERENLVNKVKQLEAAVAQESNPADVAELTELYNRLNESSSDAAEAQAIKILKGLGFTNELMKMPTSALSGGWRMRIALACALYIKPDLLMLDEPTNHLDLPSVIWLQDYLQQLEDMILIVVSHDRAFLNAVATDIIFFNNKKLKYHPGNWDSFQQRKEEKLHAQQKKHEKEEKKKKEIKESIEKYKQQVRAHNPSGNMGMVRSRKKQLDKIGGPELIDGGHKKLFDLGWAWGGEEIMKTEVEEDKKFIRFHFEAPDNLGTHGPVLQLSHVTFGYEKSGKPLFQDVSMDITTSSRIAILGRNGAGKSTFVQCILGTLTPTSGSIYRHQNLKIGYFSQHHVEQLDLSLTPLQHMTLLFGKDFKEDKLRAQLGAFGISGKLATQQIKTLSGGQKSRVSLATEAFKRPHIFLLDEVTNHLDMHSIDAIIAGLQEFEGGIVLISHDQFAVQCVAKELYVLEKGKLINFHDDFEGCIEHILDSAKV